MVSTRTYGERAKSEPNHCDLFQQIHVVSASRPGDDLDADAVVGPCLRHGSMVDLHGVDRLLQIGGMPKHLNLLPEQHGWLQSKRDHADLPDVILDQTQEDVIG